MVDDRIREADRLLSAIEHPKTEFEVFLAEEESLIEASSLGEVARAYSEAAAGEEGARNALGEHRELQGRAREVESAISESRYGTSAVPDPVCSENAHLRQRC